MDQLPIPKKRRPMRIGIDARLPFYQLGGISQATLHLLPALAALDSDHTYLIFHLGRDQRDYTPAAPQFKRRRLWTPCHHRLERWALTLELLPQRLDVWHSPDFIPPQRGARRQVITVHDLNFLYYPQYLTRQSRRYYLDQIAWAVRRADSVAADSEHTRQDIIQRLNAPPDKVRTVYLAANPLYSRPVTPAEIADTLTTYSLPAGYILFVGTLEPRKNLPLLLEAYDQLRAVWGFDRPLVLVGRRGWLWEEIVAALHTPQRQGWVRHLEGVDDRRLAHLYHAAAALALPSWYEGFGLPALEALHCGCPVVCSNRASLPEVVGEAGLLLEPDDPTAWAAALARAAGDATLRATLRQQGYLQAQRFSWNQTARQMQALYVDSC